MNLRNEIFKYETEILIQEALQADTDNPDNQSKIQKNISNLIKNKSIEVSIEDFHLNYINNNIVMTTYTAVKKHKNRTLEPTLRRSIWHYKDNKWTNSFHKEIKTI